MWSWNLQLVGKLCATPPDEQIVMSSYVILCSYPDYYSKADVGLAHTKCPARLYRYEKNLPDFFRVVGQRKKTVLQVVVPGGISFLSKIFDCDGMHIRRRFERAAVKRLKKRR